MKTVHLLLVSSSSETHGLLMVGTMAHGTTMTRDGLLSTPNKSDLSAMYATESVLSPLRTSTLTSVTSLSPTSVTTSKSTQSQLLNRTKVNGQDLISHLMKLQTDTLELTSTHLETILRDAN